MAGFLHDWLKAFIPYGNHDGVKETAFCSQPDLTYNSGESYILSVCFTLLTYEIGTNNIYLVVNAFKV